MIKITPLILALSIDTVEIEKIKTYKIPYECLYEKLPPNKNTIEFNYLKTEELIRQQNQKLIEEIFLR
jgi:recombinational DNA repair protein RecR